MDLILGATPEGVVSAETAARLLFALGGLLTLLLLGLIFLALLRRHAARRIARLDGDSAQKRRRDPRIDAWAEAGRRAPLPIAATDLHERGDDDDTVDLDPPEAPPPGAPPKAPPREPRR